MITQDDWDETTSGDLRTREIALPQTHARLVSLTGQDAGRVYQLPLTAPSFIGRDSQAQVSLDAADVSRRHASISMNENGHWTIEDLGSRNGTLVNALPIQGRHVLAFGDHIQVGASALFIFTYHDQVQDQVLQAQKMESIGRIAGGVAHDFANLLTVIRVTTDEILGGMKVSSAKVMEELAENLDMITRATDQAFELTKRLLAFSRPETSPQQVTDLSGLIGETLGLAGRTFPEGICTETAIDPGLHVMGARSQLHQVLMNLLINARDAIPEGGTLRVRAKLKSFEDLPSPATPLLPACSYVLVAISDTGAGMPDEVRQRAFEPFFSTKGPHRGTGLGLSTVYSVVKAHGGHVQIQSAVGQGTTVEVYLPAHNT